jgi:hypothetical protein
VDALLTTFGDVFYSVLFDDAASSNDEAAA